MIEYKAYGVKWGRFNQLQGWVIRSSTFDGEEHNLIQTIRTADTEDELKQELGIDQTDKDWQRIADLEGPWTLTWVGMVDNIFPYQGPTKELLDNALLFDPHLGLPINKYMDADLYRTALPELAWKFNPWTGDYRNPDDIANDPLGLLI